MNSSGLRYLILINLRKTRTFAEVFLNIMYQIRYAVHWIFEICHAIINIVFIVVMRKEDVMVTKTLTYMDNIKVKEVIKPSELTVIAARPAMGKTTFALKILQEAAANDNASAIYFTLDEKKDRVRQKLLSMQPDLNFENIFIEDAASSVVEICDMCKKVKDEHGLDFVVIDYLQLMGGTGKAASRKEEVAEIVRKLRNLAKELGCAVILLSELSRSPEERDDKRPRLSDFGESSVITDEADTVMFLYRDEYYHKESKAKGILEINLAKNSNGKEDMVYTRLEDFHISL